MNLEFWQIYLADVPHLLGNMPWNPQIGMFIKSKQTYFPHQVGSSDFQVKDFFPVIGSRGHNPETYEENAKDKDGYAIWDEDAQGDTNRRIHTKPIPEWINKRMNATFVGQAIEKEHSFRDTELHYGGAHVAIAGWTFLANTYELLDIHGSGSDDIPARRLEEIAGKAYDNRETLYVLATTFGPENDNLTDSATWMLFAVVPIYPYDRKGSADTIRDYRLVSIQPQNDLGRYDSQEGVRPRNLHLPNINFSKHQAFDSKRLRESVRSSQAQGFTPTSQSISRILNETEGLEGAKIWYKVSPFPGIWQSINTQQIEI